MRSIVSTPSTREDSAMRHFEQYQRVKVTAIGHPLLGQTGTVWRLHMRDDDAWITWTPIVIYANAAVECAWPSILLFLAWNTTGRVPGGWRVETPGTARARGCCVVAPGHVVAELGRCERPPADALVLGLL